MAVHHMEIMKRDVERRMGSEEWETGRLATGVERFSPGVTGESTSGENEALFPFCHPPFGVCGPLILPTPRPNLSSWAPKIKQTALKFSDVSGSL